MLLQEKMNETNIISITEEYFEKIKQYNPDSEEVYFI